MFVNPAKAPFFRGTYFVNFEIDTFTKSSFLDETTNKINDVWFFYENPGNYQLNVLHFKNIFKDGQITSVSTVDFLSLETNQESENIKLFILPSKPAYEQTN